MKLIKKPWFIPILLTIIIVIVSQLYTNQIFSKADSLTEQEVREQLGNMYGAEVNQLSMKDNKYTAELKRNGGLYTVEMDSETGKVLSMVQLKDIVVAETQPNEEVVTEENELVVEQNEEKSNSTSKPQSTEKASNPPIKKKPVVLISEERAIQIALSQLNGEVNDVDYVETTSGGYYLVEIEIEVDDGPDEATYQIHAISGEIISVAWDD